MWVAGRNAEMPVRKRSVHLLVVLASVEDGVEQLAAGAELDDEVDAPRVLEGLIKAHDVRVVEDLHDVDLVLELLRILNHVLVDGLDLNLD